MFQVIVTQRRITRRRGDAEVEVLVTIPVADLMTARCIGCAQGRDGKVAELWHEENFLARYEHGVERPDIERSRAVHQAAA